MTNLPSLMERYFEGADLYFVDELGLEIYIFVDRKGFPL